MKTKTKPTKTTQMSRKQISNKAVEAHHLIRDTFEVIGYSAGLISRMQRELVEGRYPFELVILETPEERQAIEKILLG